MPKHAFEFLDYNVTSILKNEKADNLAIFLDIKLKFLRCSPCRCLGHVFYVFLNLKFSKIFSFFTKFFTYIFIFEKFENSKQHFCILRHFMRKKWGITILTEPYFASKSIEHDVTMTSFPADLLQVRNFVQSGCVKFVYQKLLKVWCRYLYSFGRY